MVGQRRKEKTVMCSTPGDTQNAHKTSFENLPAAMHNNKLPFIIKREADRDDTLANQ